MPPADFNRTASVTDMLGELEWDILEMRRKKNRLTVIHKLSRSLVGIKTVRKTSCRIARPERIGAMRLSTEYPKFIERTFSSSLSFLDPYVNGILCLQRL